MNIVVLAGGLSTERDVSFKTGSMVAKALKENGHKVILLDVFMGYESDAPLLIYVEQKDVSANWVQTGTEFDGFNVTYSGAVKSLVPSIVGLIESDVDKGNEIIKPFILRKLDEKHLKKLDEQEEKKINLFFQIIKMCF